MREVAMPQTRRHARRGKLLAGRLGPFHEHDRPVEVRLEIAPFRGRDGREAIEVEVRDRDTAEIAVADRERRTRHRLSHAQRTTGPANEGRLARAELAGDSHDV